jgi:hypothetical protein
MSVDENVLDTEVLPLICLAFIEGCVLRVLLEVAVPLPLSNVFEYKVELSLLNFTSKVSFDTAASVLILTLNTKSVYVAGIDVNDTDAALDAKTFELIKV